MRRLPVVLVLVGILLAACSGSDGTVTGSVIEVSGDLLQVDSFTVLSEGTVRTFVPQEGATFSIPLVHLRDHLRSGEPVEVAFFEVEGLFIASDVVDANRHP